MTVLMAWLIALVTGLSEEKQRRLGEYFYPAGYHAFLCQCCSD